MQQPTSKRRCLTERLSPFLKKGKSELLTVSNLKLTAHTIHLLLKMHVAARVGLWALVSATLAILYRQAATPSPLFFLLSVLTWSCAIPVIRSCVKSLIQPAELYQDACLYAVFNGVAFIGILLYGTDVLSQILISSSGILVLLKYSELSSASTESNFLGAASLLLLWSCCLNHGRGVALALFATEFCRHACLLGRLSSDDRVRGSINCFNFLFWLTFRVGVLAKSGVEQFSLLLLCFQVYEVMFFPVVFVSYMDV